MISIEVTKEDAKKAGDYLNHTDCLLGTALKRHFPEKVVWVGGHTLKLGNVLYDISEKTILRLRDFYRDTSTLVPFTAELMEIENETGRD